MQMANHAASRLAVDTRTDSVTDKTPSSSSHSLTPPETPITESSSGNGERTVKSHENANIELFPYDLELERTSDDPANPCYTEFGRGVWSAVYKATTTWSPRADRLPPTIFTPPPSPVPAPSKTSPNKTTSPSSSSRSRIVAVKAPLRRDAHAVLRAEAQIMTLIMRTTPTYDHIYNDDGDSNSVNETDAIVPFYGYMPASHSLVLQAIPLSLATHIESCAIVARKHFSTRTMFEPVVSSAQWRQLAHQLIKGLEWLHNVVGVVHADIKPHNILLRPKRHTNTDSTATSNNSGGAGFEYEALFADFSSAHFVRSSLSSAAPDKEQEPQPQQQQQSGAASSSSSSFKSSSSFTGMSALTPPFAAPELMTVAAMKSAVVPTAPASDVFALALTLLAAATGDTLVYSAAASGVTSDMQRLAMSRDGHHALDYVRNGPNASRVVRGGLVEKMVRPAIVREPADRVAPAQWLNLLESIYNLS